MSVKNLLQEVEDSYARLTEDELANLGVVLGAFRSFRGNRRGHIAYVSMPITSGKRLFDVFEKENVRSVDELAVKYGKDALFELVIKPNVAEGIALANSLGRREDLLFVAPSVFEAKKWRWSQDAYMSLWYRVIGEMAGKLVVSDGWEYSTGGVEEVMFALFLRWRILRVSNLEDGISFFGLKNFHPGMTLPEVWEEIRQMWAMRIFDAHGKEILLLDALEQGIAAIEYLKERHFSYEGLLRKAWKISCIPFFTPDFYEPDDEFGDEGREAWYTRLSDAKQKMTALTA